MVEGDGLENRYTLTGIEGSNPSLSAIYFPLPISGKKRIFYSKALKVVGKKGFA